MGISGASLRRHEEKPRSCREDASVPDQQSVVCEEKFWTMTNGYAICTEMGLARIGQKLRAMDAQ